MNVKLLLGRGTPRGYIPAVEANNPLLPVDKIIPKYYPEYFAYKIMRNYFLQNPQYTHLVLATDDIVVEPKHVQQLQRDLEAHDYPVLSGLMNVDLDDKTYVNLTMTLPMKKRTMRKYVWLTRKDIFVKEDIFQVAFSGFPLMAIRRDVLEKVTFDADRVFEGLPPDRGASLDFVFCWYCAQQDIPVMVDKRIDMLHLRTAGGLEVGKKHKRLVLWGEGGEPYEVSPDPYL